MTTLRQKTIAGFLATTVSAMALYFALPMSANAQMGNQTSAIYKQCVGKIAANFATSNLSGKGESAAEMMYTVGTTNGAAASSKWNTYLTLLYDCLKEIAQIIMKMLFNAFKKRLLDRLTDDVIGWINGNGKPKFLTDFGGELRKVAEDSIGDTLEQIPVVGNLCNEKLGVQLRMNVSIPSGGSSLYKESKCSLDKVVQNVEAFGDNFQNGSWLAYQELNEPQNNILGLQVLALDNLTRTQSEKAEAKKAEISTADGFAPTKMCLKWTILGNVGGAPDTFIDKFDKNDKNRIKNNNEKIAGILDDPNASDPAKQQYIFDNLTDHEKKNIEARGAKNVRFVCKPEDQQITTPGQALATTLTNSMKSDNEYLVNADDLSAYIGGIFDAAINRLTKKGMEAITTAAGKAFNVDRGVRGLGGMPVSDTSGKSAIPTAGDFPETPPAPAPTDPCKGSDAVSIEKCAGQNAGQLEKKKEIEDMLARASSSVATAGRLMAEIAMKHASAYQTVSDLATCQQTKATTSAACPTTQTALSELGAIGAGIGPVSTELASMPATLANYAAQARGITKATKIETVLTLHGQAQEFASRAEALASTANQMLSTVSGFRLDAFKKELPYCKASFVGQYKCPAN